MSIRTINKIQNAMTTKHNTFRRTAISCTEHTPGNYILGFINENHGKKVMVEYETFATKFGTVELKCMVLNETNLKWLREYMGDPSTYLKNPYAKFRRIALVKDDIATSAEI